MFLWSDEKKSRRKGRSNKELEENEFGIKLDKGLDDEQLEAELKRLAGVTSLPEDDVNLNEGEEDVESELLRLIGGGKEKKPSRKPAPSEELVKDISELTADINLDEEDVEVDENDPELLRELLELNNEYDEEIEEEEAELVIENKSSGDEPEIITTLKERLSMYKRAEANAKKNNESSRARRFARGIKTLEDLLKKAKLGKVVSPNDIPPVIALNLKPTLPQPEMPGLKNEAPKESKDLADQCDSTVHVQDSTTPSEPRDIMEILIERLELYQTAEAKAKENGDTSRARRFGRGIKTLESLIKEVQAGKEVVLENIPPMVALNLKPAPAVSIKCPDDSEEKVNNEEEDINEKEDINAIDSFDDIESEQKEKQKQLPEKNVMDVLIERLKMYKIAEAKAKEDGETSRARRFNRGIKTLQDLIKQATEGRPIILDDIPPVVALNLKPAPSIIVKEEEKFRGASVERENLMKSSNAPEKPLSFIAVDDVDVDEELIEEIPVTVLEGLEQRMRFYSKFQEKAKEEGNWALAEQNEKIVRTYLNAIKTFKKGEYVDVENLPNPKGCPPIPIPFFVP